MSTGPKRDDGKRKITVTVGEYKKSMTPEEFKAWQKTQQRDKKKTRGHEDDDGR